MSTRSDPYIERLLADLRHGNKQSSLYQGERFFGEGGTIVRKKPVLEKRTSKMKPGRDPEDRVVDPANGKAKREKMLDKTIADSFPASDAPSSLPDPSEDSFCE